MRTPGGQRVQAALGAPCEVAAEIRFGVLAGGALEAGQVGSYRQSQPIGERLRRIGGRRGQFGEGHHAPDTGADHHPAWYHNLRAHPDAVTIEVGGRHIPVCPREAGGAEREEPWRLVNDNYNGYQVYQQRAGHRIIPVVLLEPA